MGRTTKKTETTRDYLLRTTPEGANFHPVANGYLTERAIDDDVAEARGYRFLTIGSVLTSDDDLLRSVGIPDSYFRDGATAYLMPLWALGIDEPVLSQVRVQNPESTTSGARFKTPRGAARGDRRGGLPADVNPIVSNVNAVRDASRPLIITEGAAKADSMISALRREGRGGRQAAGVVSFTGVGLAVQTGADGERDALAPQTLGSSEWAPLLRDRDVVIAYDGDFASKSAVAESLRRLAIVLQRDGNVERVRIIDLSTISDEELPERLRGGKIGIDDYLAAIEEMGGEERPMSALLRGAGRWDTIEKKLIKSKVLHPRPVPLPLGSIELDHPLSAWIAEADDDVLDEVSWARDEAGNAVVRATGDSGKDFLGSWRLDVAGAVARFLTEGDKVEAQRIVTALESVPSVEAAQLLSEGYEAVTEALGLAPSNDLAVRVLGLREAIESVKRGGAGISIPLYQEWRGGAQMTLTAEISAKAAQHGLFEVIVVDPEKPAIRNQILPYVLAKWSIQTYNEVLGDLSLRPLGDETRFVGAAIFAGGRVETYDGLDSDSDDDPVALVRGLKGQGVAIREPIGRSEPEAAKRCIASVGVDERQKSSRVNRMGWVRLRDGGHAWTSTIGAVTAEGISDEITAARGPDRDSNRELRVYERSIGFDAVATDDELARWPELLSDLLDLAPDAVSIPVFGQFFRSFLPQENGARTATVAVVAPPGAMKSALVSRCGYLMSSARKGSVKHIAIDRDTKAAVENSTPFFAHQPVIGDDYRPSKDRFDEKRQTDVVDTLVSGAFDQDTARKALSNGANRASAQFLGSPITSAETTFGTKTSRLERQLTIRIEHGDIIADDLDAFNAKWIDTGLGRRLVAAYLRGIARALDENPENPSLFDVSLRDIEDDYRRRFGMGSDRPSLAALQVLSGIGLFIEIMTYETADRTDPDDEYTEAARAHFLDLVHETGTARGIVRALAAAQHDEHKAAGAGAKILETIIDGIESGAFHLTGPDGGVPAGAERFGYVVKEDVHGKRTFEPSSRSVALGRVSVDGTKVLLLVTPLDKVREAVGERLTKADLKTRLMSSLSAGFESKGGEKISGLTVDDAGKAYPMRGYVIDLSRLGIDPVTEADSTVPTQSVERRVKAKRGSSKDGDN